MDKYEYRVKTEQLLEYTEKRQYRKAMAIADTIDWRRVKNASMLNTVSEIYEYCGEHQKSRDILFMAFDRAPGSRKIVYRLGTLAIKLSDAEEATDCYEEFVKLAPKDPNQYILKYKILKLQGAPLEEQIETLEEFKKAEYIEKWAYELAKLYYEAGMTKECLEECDDLILWFSEGKYVYLAMELKMKYKPLTPLQQEKYDKRKKELGEAASHEPVVEEEEESEEDTAEAEEVREAQTVETAGEEVPEERNVATESADAVQSNTWEERANEEETAEEEIIEEETAEEEIVEDEAADEMPDSSGISAYTDKIIQETEEQEMQEAQTQEEGLQEPVYETGVDKAASENEAPAKEHRSAITRVVKGATLEEALASGVAIAASINKEEKNMAQREEQLRISGQMKIEEILQEWEEKQKVNADTIERQKQEDAERLKKEREEAERRMEESRRAVEEAARKAQEEAARRAQEEAARKAAEEEARRKAEEEARREAEEAARRAVEEAARKAAEEAARKAEEEAKRKAEEEAKRKAEEEARKTAEEEAARKAAEEAAKKAAEEEAAKKAAEEEARRKAEEEKKKKADEEAARKALEALDNADEKKNVLEEKTQRLPDDIMELVEQLESRVSGGAKKGVQIEDEDDLEGAREEDFAEDFDELGLDFDEDMPEADEEDFVEEEDFEEEDLVEEEPEELEEAEEVEPEELEETEAEEEPEELEEAEVEEIEPEEVEAEEVEPEELVLEEENDEPEDEFEEEDFAEVLEEDELEEESFSEDEFEEEDFAEAGFEETELEEEDFSEDEFEEDELDEEDFAEEDFAEDEFEEDEFEEDELDEEDFVEEDFEEDELDEEDFSEDDFEEDFAEDELDEEDFDEDDFEEDIPKQKVKQEVPLEIEEPSEEEIQKRIKKSKGGGVPFDTGFVVTGRYDLSATSEIGLKAGLTEEQKKLFSYFVPVRGMSEQIVEVLDNDRRAQRGGTSRTGNILVVGRQGSGKTVLAVDIVKAIQKQRNLKQGKVAIVTGESLNKKELTNIIQKLRGGAIIVEKAGKLNARTIKELNRLMERKTGEMLFVLEDQRKPLERMMTANPEFKKKFTSKLELPIFINDELVTFGQTYAKENGYKLDEMGILALYSRIDVMQREDHAVSVAEVKDIMDEAIAHSQKANVKHLARRVFGKGTDNSDRIILKEEDFRI